MIVRTGTQDFPPSLYQATGWPFKVLSVDFPFVAMVDPEGQKAAFDERRGFLEITTKAYFDAFVGEPEPEPQETAKCECFAMCPECEAQTTKMVDVEELVNGIEFSCESCNFQWVEQVE